MTPENPPPAEADGQAPLLRGLALLIALGTVLLFAPARNFTFVNFDDDVFVFTNGMVKSGFNWASVKWALLSADIDYWRPLSWLSHMLDVELYGLAPGGHHLTSVLIHALNAAVLCFALHALTGRVLPSAMVAALFAWHPLHIESVVWVAERKDVLCALFWFLGLWAYAWHARAPGPRRMLLVAACFVLGLASKPMILTFPFLLLVLDVWPLKRLELSCDLRASAQRLLPLVKEKLPLFALVVLAAVGTYLAQRQVGAMMPEAVHPLSARLANVPVAYVRYLGLTAWPVDLALLYPLPGGWPLWQVGGALALLACISWLAVARLSRTPWLAAGWFWFLGTLVPVIGIVQVGDQSIANRYTYVPLIGLFLALVWLADDWRARRGGSIAGWGALATAVLLLCAFGLRRELWHWRDGVAIFEQAVRVTHNNFVAMTNLGNNLARMNQHAAAIDLYQQALRVRPASSETHYNLGSSLADTGQRDGAERHFREAIRIHPGHAQAHNNLANLLADTGRVPDAIRHYEESLRLRPGNVLARFNYGITLADLGRPADALTQFAAAVERQPDFTRARLQMVTILAAQGRNKEAMAQNAELLRHDPTSPEGLFNAGSLAAALGDWAGAVRHWQDAVRAKPDFLPALHRLTWTLATHGQTGIRNPTTARELATHFTKITGEQNPEALDLLAVAHAAGGDFQRATQFTQRALAALGTNQPPFAVELRARLALFQAGKPFLEGVPK